MAYKLIEAKQRPYANADVCELICDTNTDVLKFLCDTDADVANLPQCCPSSTAVSISTGNIYVVNASGQWVKFGG